MIKGATSVVSTHPSSTSSLVEWVGNTKVFWAVWFTYDLLVTRPLRTFYFEGPIWKNQPAEEICYEMTGVEARHWTMTPENMARCHLEMERRFMSWDRTAMTVAYFALLTFLLIRLVCCCSCFCDRFPSSSSRRYHHDCGCESRPVTKEEMADAIRAAISASGQQQKKVAVPGC